MKYVSRAAKKLELAVAKLDLDFRGKVALDVGASTGGFTDFALSRGATKVYAVEKGTAQLHPKLRADPRVVSMEKTDIRAVKQLPEPIELALIDVSFTSIRPILLTSKTLLAPGGQIVALVKPQFEAEADQKHQGVIKNDRIRRQILNDFEGWAKGRFAILAKADSAVSGSKGNIERFYTLKAP